MALQRPTTINPDSSYADITLFDNGRFKNVDRDTVETIRTLFKKHNTSNTGLMDQFEVSRMFEALGEAKTATEVRQAIAEVDADKDGKISFSDFLAMISGPAPAPDNVPVPVNEAPTAATGRAATTGLSGRALFFEQQMHASAKNPIAENKAQIDAQLAEKKRIASVHAAEEERIRAEKAEDERKKNDSRSKLAARAVIFSV
ncbi:hypothetical protein SmJEL517_g02541 [Synchytrium microbalum]|uniref:EF-hand domain-containing protein n=1 Tax=Synchytrium microbalum TaxID=1806994 RepID=A0A507C6Z1_9FUNG|nr:uncharacterized protein SmJEL517_g02541 [Synchytrium microbalum]TPX34889.1 hypothetical protein SmJEL517_g02541 [Synchytrium microbalum]